MNAATFDAAMKLDTNRASVSVLSLRGSGRFDGNTTVRTAVNMDGVEVRLAAIYRAVVQNLSVLGRIRFNNFLATFHVFLRQQFHS